MDVTGIKGIGESSAKLLAKVGIHTALDLVMNVPRDYEDYSHIQTVRSMKPGNVTLQVTFSSITQRYSKKGLHMTEALASDKSGSVKVVWFNQPYRSKSIKQGEQYYLSGEFAFNYKYLVINNPTIELTSDFPIHTARLVPKYRLTKGLSVHMLRKYTKAAFDALTIDEPLPEWVLKKYELAGYGQSLLEMHFPKTIDTLKIARKRLGFQELFELLLASELNKNEYGQEEAPHVPFQEDVVQSFVSNLPFALTDDQRRSAWAILQDMTEGHPMNRLLEGDVGSGKTVVAAIAARNVIAGGFQVAVMAPTEILAAQHAQTLYDLMPEDVRDRTVFLTGSMKPSQKQAAHKRIANGDALLIVGTHALIAEKVSYDRLGFVVIDEQHRFGVEQRKELQKKAQTMPHVLHMTATPIPRSLVLTLYGEMDVSIIAQKPANRKAIHTSIINPEQRQKLYSRLNAPLDRGRQVFVVCPHIDETVEKLSRSLSAVSIHKQLKSWLKKYSVEVLHGKMKSKDKEAIMQRFVDGDIQVLVSTTVVEVGVDVPNASVMVIEGADRFGLAQLHQLRGRVGRGEHSSQCILVTTDNAVAPHRLKKLTEENDGFVLAEYDLELRGPGAIYGTLQHGALDLRVANISDRKLVVQAREAARELIAQDKDLLHYKQLRTRVHELRKITNLN